MTLAAFIELIAKIKQKNNGTFKLVDAQDVECEDGKGLDEVLNEKLDKNQGVENAGKTMVVGADGNLVVGDSSPKNVYTKEEVDYLLDDKMDKPYVPIEVADSATITDALEGNFKIDKIKGNTYQNVETDIKPTPSRPVPINSRKTLVTKTNPNMFNFEKENDISSIPDTGTYRSIGQHQLKPNTKYVFSWSGATVPAKATLSFQIQNDKGTVLVSPFTYFNLEATEKKEAGKEVEFTTNESGIVKFAYNCTVATSSTTETYQQYWYTKILKDISLKEDVEYEPEYVELRSLKETSNLFDKNIHGFKLGFLRNTGEVGDTNTFMVSDYIAVNPNTKYIYNLVDGFRNSTKLCFDKDKNVVADVSSIAFTTPANCYYVRYQIAANDNRVLMEEDIKNANDNTMFVEGESLPPTYIPPTIRDYKIVDHTTKTSKIVRNVHTTSFNKNSKWSRAGNDNKGYRFVVIEKQPVKVLNYLEVNNGFSNMSKNDKNSIVNDNKSGSGWYCTSNSYSIKVDGLQMGTLDDFKQLLGDNEIIFQCQLATAIEETIAYSADDVSEVGYSWQDTTSPSPTIKSEVKSVEKIDILKTGKNLFDVEKAKDIGSWDGGNAYKHFTGICFEPNTTYTFSVSKNNMFLDYKNEYNNKIAFYIGETIDSASPNVVIGNSGLNSSNAKTLYTFTTTEKPMYLNLYVNRWDVRLFNIVFEELLQNIQIEVGDTATAYEPYAEQRVNYTPTNPMYSTQDGSIADYVDVEKGVEVYQLKKVIFDGSEDETWKLYAGQNGFYILLNDMMVGRGQQGFCDKFKIVSSVSLTGIVLGQGNNYLYVTQVNSYATTIEELRTWLSQNPITVVYPLVFPTETPIPLEDLAKLKSLKTNAGVNNIFVGGEVKPTIEARYPRDLALVQQQLEQKVLLMSETLTATQAKLLLQGGN